MEKTFGSVFKEFRIASGCGLREFCIKNNFDPVSISKIERDRAPVPCTDQLLSVYAKALGIIEDSEEWQILKQCADRQRKYRSIKKLTGQSLIDKLPSPLFVSNLNPNQIDRLIEKIANA